MAKVSASFMLVIYVVCVK